jgi:hypothetical protein
MPCTPPQVYIFTESYLEPSCTSSALGLLVSWASGLTRLATGPPGVTSWLTTHLGPPQLAKCSHAVSLPGEYAPNNPTDEDVKEPLAEP